jgi:hypothetical protein
VIDQTIFIFYSLLIIYSNTFTMKPTPLTKPAPLTPEELLIVTQKLGAFRVANLVERKAIINAAVKVVKGLPSNAAPAEKAQVREVCTDGINIYRQTAHRSIRGSNHGCITMEGDRPNR